MTFITTEKTIWLGDSVKYTANESALSLQSNCFLHLSIFVCSSMGGRVRHNAHVEVSVRVPQITPRVPDSVATTYACWAILLALRSLWFIVLTFKLILKRVDTCAFLCGETVHFSARACGDTQMLDSLEQDSQVVLSHLRQVLGTELQPLAGEVHTPDHRAISPGPLLCYF